MIILRNILALSFLLSFSLFAVDPSNPGETRWKCLKEIVVDGGSEEPSDKEVCKGQTKNLPDPTTMAKTEISPTFEKGSKACVDENDNIVRGPFDVHYGIDDYTWTFDKNLADLVNQVGTHTVKLIGTPTTDPDPCQKPSENLEYEFDFIVKDFRITGLTEVIPCAFDVLKLTAVGGEPPYTWKIKSGAANIKINPFVNKCDVNGLKLGKAVIEVTDKHGCKDEHPVNVVSCRIISPPRFQLTIFPTGGGDLCPVGGTKEYKVGVTVVAGTFKKLVNGRCDEFDITIPEEDITYKWELKNPGAPLIIVGGVDNKKEVTVEKDTALPPLFDDLKVTVKGLWSACEVYNEEIEKDKTETVFAGCPPRTSSHQPSNQFTNSDIYGQPKLIQKPQAASESDNATSKFSVNAYALTASFSTTDISVPLQGSDLRLELRRSNSPDTVNLIPEQNTPLDFENEPYKKLLGRSWRTNIAARIHLRNEYEEVDLGNGNSTVINESIFTVMDDSGGQFRYWQGGYDDDEGFTPVKDSFNDQNSSHHKLHFEDEELIWTKRNGTVYRFEKIPVPDQFLVIRLSHLFRVVTITDRNGNQLEYVYDDTVNSNFPEEIRYVQQPNLKIEFEYETITEQVGFFTQEVTKLKSAKDPKGRIIEYEYYDNGQLHKVVHPEVEVASDVNPKITSPATLFEEYEYEILDNSGFLIFKNKDFYVLSKLKDFKGNTTSFKYIYHRFSNNDKGRLQLDELTTPDGHSKYETISHSDTGRNNQITDNEGNVWKYEFSTTRRFTFRNNNSIEFLLDQFSRTVTPADGSVSKTMFAEFEADDFNNVNLRKITDYSGVNYTYEYGTNVDIEYYKDGVIVPAKYDFSRYSQPRFEILDPITPENPDGLNIKKEFNYEPDFNQLVKIVGPRGFEDGNDPDKFTTWYDIDSINGNRIREIAPEDKETSFTYEFGFQTSVVDADGRKTIRTREYNNEGWSDTTTITGYNNELAITTKKICDLVGNVIQIVDGNGNITVNTFDDMNFITKTTLPPVFDYDSNTTKSPIYLFNRNENRQTVGKRDARGNWTLSTYDKMRRPIKTIVEVSKNNSDNIISETKYDRLGNKLECIDARGTKYRFKYDAFNNLTEEIKDFGEGQEYLNLKSSYEYGDFSGNDLFGNVGFVPTKKVDPRGIVTIFEYDNAYRIIKTKRGYEGAEVLINEITYNAAGNVTKTINYNSKILNIEGNYVDDTENISQGNQEIITIYDDLNRPITTVVNLDGPSASELDSGDIITHTVYDKSGNIILVIDPEGHSTQIEFDGANRDVKTVVNLDDNPEFVMVNNNSYTIKSDTNDIVRTKLFDKNNNVLEKTIINDSPGAVGQQTVSMTFDSLNRIKSVIDQESNVTETKYDLNNNVRFIKNARGYVTITEYDEANRAFLKVFPEVYDAESGIEVNPKVETFYDQNNNVVKSIDTRGLVTINVYDSINRLIETRNVVGENDNFSQENDDIVSLKKYDDNDNQIQTIFKRDDVDLETNIEFDSLDRPYITKDPEGFYYVVFYDLVGNKVKLFDKRANSNIDETPNEIPLLRYCTTVTFDLANRIVKNTFPEIPYYEHTVIGLSNEIVQRPFSEINYLKNNWVDSTVDLNGNITKTIYDNAGRKIKSISAIGQETSYVYDKSNNILEQTVKNSLASGGDQITSFEYDKRNLMVKEILNKNDGDLSRVYTFSYDENSNKKTRLFPNGKLTRYHYDSQDRVILEEYVGDETENREYKYTNKGAVSFVNDPTGITENIYDILGREIKEIKKDHSGNITSIIENEFDKSNNRIRCYFPNDKKTIVSHFDKRNLLITMKGYHGKVLPSDEDDELPEITTYTYNGNKLQLSCSLPNGQTNFNTFDQANRISLSTTLANNLHIYTADYKRDAAGNQLQTIETRYDLGQNRVRTLDFTYDKIYRLTKERDDVSGQLLTTEYEYDLQGNRLNKISKNSDGIQTAIWIYSTDKLNRTTSVAYKENNNLIKTYDYEFDLNGNRSAKLVTDEITSQTVVDHTYIYDRENRLSEVQDPEGKIFTATYDYRTRRMSKGEGKSTSQNNLVSTKYIYDRGVTCQEVEEHSGIDVLVKQYIRGNSLGGGIGSVCYMERQEDLNEASSNIQEFYNNLGYGNNASGLIPEYYAYNAVGSVVANTDQDGFVIRENDFDAYGNQVREQDWESNNFPIEFGGSANDLLFSTKERDFSTGLDYFGFRYYDPVLGKFTTRDPSGYPDGPNNYVYASNNPINKIDPLGLEDTFLGWVYTIVNHDTKEVYVGKANSVLDRHTSGSHPASHILKQKGTEITARPVFSGNAPSSGAGTQTRGLLAAEQTIINKNIEAYKGKGFTIINTTTGHKAVELKAEKVKATNEKLKVKMGDSLDIKKQGESWSRQAYKDFENKYGHTSKGKKKTTTPGWKGGPISTTTLRKIVIVASVALSLTSTAQGLEEARPNIEKAMQKAKEGDKKGAEQARDDATLDYTLGSGQKGSHTLIKMSEEGAKLKKEIEEKLTWDEDRDVLFPWMKLPRLKKRKYTEAEEKELDKLVEEYEREQSSK